MESVWYSLLSTQKAVGRFASLWVIFRIGPALVGSGAEQQEALQGQHRESWTTPAPCCREGKNNAVITGDVSESCVYSISPTNPLPKSDLSRDGQIIQLSEVSGMVIVSQPFCSLSS